MTSLRTSTIGFPRTGPKREMKMALEKYWGKKITESELLEVSDKVALQSLRDQEAAGVDLIGVGDHTLYDHVLDWSERFGLTCKRVREAKLTGLEAYFTQARGRDGIPALDMTKYFDSNYHYMVPEVGEDTVPRADFSSFVAHVQLLRSKAAKADSVVPIVLGPVTLAKLCKYVDGTRKTAAVLVKELVPLYKALLEELGRGATGVKEVQLHEPWLVMSDAEKGTEVKILTEAVYKELSSANSKGPAVNLCVHFDSLSPAVYSYVVELPVQRVTLDFCRSKAMVEMVEKQGFPSTKELGAGVVDGRNVWRNEAAAGGLLQRIQKAVQDDARVVVAPSCSLQFVPYDLDHEEEGSIPSEVRSKLAFAKQKLEVLTKLASSSTAAASPVEWIGEDNLSGVEGAKGVTPEMYTRSEPFKERRGKQLAELPDFPTTTIGSFPQTAEIRKLRREWKEGKVGKAAYEEQIDKEIERVVGIQKEIGLDVFVHGEAERSDMVEYFAQKLDGMLLTRHGWVQSYGSRYVRPPVIHGAVVRKGGAAMTVREFAVCQKASGAVPVKGMLTGPVTILNWSFCRVDVPRAEQAVEVALAVREEVADLEAAGCRVVQVDEAALRERMPLKKEESEKYLEWAVACFRLSTCGARPSTQVVTHMCYSTFEDIIGRIDGMDADVLTIENSRSAGEMVAALSSYGYARDLGAGVYDIHSPVVPTMDDMAARLQGLLSLLPPSRTWVNPDCGLKTRKWDEVIPSLKNMVTAAHKLRESHVSA
eukprot:TRINITY_DN59_c0_g1_i11.p1 TRINITY_DN59_c0_g1~~TRINITY_DN59_c0_g1_i11.p1  ORF type:complete len:789 (+),score=300.23 TRINITY_DN59_c0_g1_i11:80-2368(+)